MGVEHRSLCWVGDQREQPLVAPPLVRDQLRQQLTLTAGIQAQPSRFRVRLDVTVVPTPKLLTINDDQLGELVIPAGQVHAEPGTFHLQRVRNPRSATGSNRKLSHRAFPTQGVHPSQRESCRVSTDTPNPTIAAE